MDEACEVYSVMKDFHEGNIFANRESCWLCSVFSWQNLSRLQCFSFRLWDLSRVYCRIFCHCHRYRNLKKTLCLASLVYLKKSAAQHQYKESAKNSPFGSRICQVTQKLLLRLCYGENFKCSIMFLFNSLRVMTYIKSCIKILRQWIKKFRVTHRLIYLDEYFASKMDCIQISVWNSPHSPAWLYTKFAAKWRELSSMIDGIYNRSTLMPTLLF